MLGTCTIFSCFFPEFFRRAHSQLTQVIREYRKTTYRVPMSILATFIGFTDNREEGRNELWSLPNQRKGQGFAKFAPNSTTSELLKKPPFHNPSGTKPLLASISVDKSFSEVNSCFTIPISTSPGVLSELPTPSTMPSTLGSGLTQSTDGPIIPTYNFGIKMSTPAFIFSFPSTSTASMQDDASNIKFSFGSDKKKRVSFRGHGLL